MNRPALSCLLLALSGAALAAPADQHVVVAPPVPIHLDRATSFTRNAHDFDSNDGVWFHVVGTASGDFAIRDITPPLFIFGTGVCTLLAAMPDESQGLDILCPPLLAQETSELWETRVGALPEKLDTGATASARAQAQQDGRVFATVAPTAATASYPDLITFIKTVPSANPPPDPGTTLRAGSPPRSIELTKPATFHRHGKPFTATQALQVHAEVDDARPFNAPAAPLVLYGSSVCHLLRAPDGHNGLELLCPLLRAGESPVLWRTGKPMKETDLDEVKTRTEQLRSVQERRSTVLGSAAGPAQTFKDRAALIRALPKPAAATKGTR
ncbi:MAG: hypothetical protein JST92_18170 [Deltaproteobacteria bacterium]|nr:hypothetical protein [Deltaproteobacteria bacterium]